MLTPEAKLQDHVSNQIKLFLKDAHMSQRELARELGIREAVLSRRMTGAVRWALGDVFNTAEVLGVDPCQLLPLPAEEGYEII